MSKPNVWPNDHLSRDGMLISGLPPAEIPLGILVYPVPHISPELIKDRDNFSPFRSVFFFFLTSKSMDWNEELGGGCTYICPVCRPRE